MWSKCASALQHKRQQWLQIDTHYFTWWSITRAFRIVYFEKWWHLSFVFFSQTELQFNLVAILCVTYCSMFISPYCHNSNRNMFCCEIAYRKFETQRVAAQQLLGWKEKARSVTDRTAVLADYPGQPDHTLAYVRNSINLFCMGADTMNNMNLKAQRYHHVFRKAIN